jgi:hypothetical protein
MSEDRHPAGSGQELPSTQTGEPTGPSAGARSPGRRGFLLGTGGLAAAALVGPGGRGSGSAQAGSAGPPPPNRSGRDPRWMWRPAAPKPSSCASPPPTSSSVTRSPTGTQRRRGPLRRRWAGHLHQGPAPQPPGRGRPGRLPGPAAGPAQRPPRRLPADPAGWPGQAGQPRGRLLLRAPGPRPLAAAPATTPVHCQ